MRGELAGRCSWFGQVARPLHYICFRPNRPANRERGSKPPSYRMYAPGNWPHTDLINSERLGGWLSVSHSSPTVDVTAPASARVLHKHHWNLVQFKGVCGLVVVAGRRAYCKFHHGIVVFCMHLLEPCK